jgi:pimeloyl-ACP methyl ester carboxylesterase
MDSKPTVFVLVPGAFNLPSVFNALADRLRSHNHEVEIAHLPSLGRKEGKPAAALDDAEHVRSLVTKQLSSGNNVVLAGSSYGGFVITEAAKGLLDPSITANNSGKLIRLVYFASLPFELNTTVSQMVEGKQPMPTTIPGNYLDPMPAEIAGPVLCSQATPEKQVKYGGMSAAQSLPSFHDKLTYQGWKHIPSTFVIGEKDLAVDAAWQHEKVDEAIKGGFDVKKVVLEDGDHFVWVSQKDAVVDVLLQAATGTCTSSARRA